ncbi:MAG: TIGR03792 family protein [Ilumatobacteraceae bacterium]
MASHGYTSGERLPIEVLVFTMDPAHVDEFLAVDHEVWTLGEAELPGFERIPFLSKEVWLDDSRPGRVTVIFVWESLDAWMAVGSAEIQARLQAEFDARFPHPVELAEAWHEDTNFGIHRWSRFER